MVLQPKDTVGFATSEEDARLQVQKLAENFNKHRRLELNAPRTKGVVQNLEKLQRVELGMTEQDLDHPEKSSWVKLSAHYDDFAGRTTRQATDVALNAVSAGPSTKLLDVATGPGYIAAEATRRGADAIGIDFSTEMIADARKRFPDLKFQLGDAENLDFSEASFDAVVCAFGLLHLPRSGKAIAEAYRVLRPGGHYSFTVWSNGPKVRLFDIIGQAVQKFADPSISMPPGPSQFMLSDPWVCSALMDAATFTDVSVSEIPSVFEAKSPQEVVEFMRKCTGRAANLYNRQTPARQLEIDKALTGAGAAAMAAGAGRIPCPALLVTGMKPL